MNNGRKSWWSKMLKHPKWQKMRLEVMERANFKCEKYGCDYPLDETNPLNVHHKYYDEENKWLEPWKYPRGSLQCLCEKHHREVHGLQKTKQKKKEKTLKALNLQEIYYENLFQHKRLYPNAPKTKRNDFILGIINFTIRLVKDGLNDHQSHSYPTELEMNGLEVETYGIKSYHLYPEQKQRLVFHDRFLFLSRKMGKILGVNLLTDYFHRKVEKYVCAVTHQCLDTTLFYHNYQIESFTDPEFSFEQEFKANLVKLSEILHSKKRLCEIGKQFNKESLIQNKKPYKLSGKDKKETAEGKNFRNASYLDYPASRKYNPDDYEKDSKGFWHLKDSVLREMKLDEQRKNNSSEKDDEYNSIEERKRKFRAKNNSKPPQVDAKYKRERIK